MKTAARNLVRGTVQNSA